MSAPVLLIGNQNVGKTTLFNALTGLSAKVANYPGVTVESRSGLVRSRSGNSFKLIDLPGTYSLYSTSEEEELTVKALFGELFGLKEHSLVVVVIDCTELRRGFYLYSQLIELGFKVVIALSMVDQLPEFKDGPALNHLKKAVGSLIVPVSARDQSSIDRLISTIDGVLLGSLHPRIKEQPLLGPGLDDDVQQKLFVVGKGLTGLPPHAKKCLDLIKNHNIFLYGLVQRQRLERTPVDIAHLGLTADDRQKLDLWQTQIPEQRYSRVDRWLKGLKLGADPMRDRSDMVDKFLLHPMFGSAILLGLFVVMLQALFMVAEPLADMLGQGVGLLGHLFAELLPESSLLRSLLLDGILAGVGSILSFVPLIALLFFMLAILEDSGYLARATYLLDATLRRTGLCGRSLMPMLSSFACAVPAIMAARTIGNKKERLITIMVTPFLTCSARLPIYALIIGALFSAHPPLFGVLDVGALMFIAMYALGILASLLAAFALSKALKTTDSQTLAIELPPYRLPDLKSVALRVADRIRLFAKDVGSVILAATILVWALFRFEPGDFSKTAERLSAGDKVALIEPALPPLSTTYAGLLGHSIEPLLSPMGLDWQSGVGLLASFLAREVFVSTMAVVYGLESSSTGQEADLRASFKSHISPLSGVCLLIFFTLSMQCVSTMAATRRETGSFFWPLLQFVIMSGSGYLLAISAYAFGSAMGWA